MAGLSGAIAPDATTILCVVATLPRSIEALEDRVYENLPQLGELKQREQQRWLERNALHYETIKLINTQRRNASRSQRRWPRMRMWRLRGAMRRT
jgi:type II secretory pathway component PulK